MRYRRKKREAESEKEREREREKERNMVEMLYVNKFLANSPNVWKISPTHPFRC